LAKKFNLAGQNEREHAEADMYADQVTDFLNELSKSRFEKDEAKKKELEAKLLNETGLYIKQQPSQIIDI
jgi:hypothetical protein